MIDIIRYISAVTLIFLFFLLQGCSTLKGPVIPGCYVATSFLNLSSNTPISRRAMGGVFDTGLDDVAISYRVWEESTYWRGQTGHAFKLESSRAYSNWYSDIYESYGLALRHSRLLRFDQRNQQFFPCIGFGGSFGFLMMDSSDGEDNMDWLAGFEFVLGFSGYWEPVEVSLEFLPYATWRVYPRPEHGSMGNIRLNIHAAF